MGAKPPVVGLLVASPALGSILSSVLATSPALRVRCFESRAGLFAYLRLVPVDIVVLDFDSESDPAGEVAPTLRDTLSSGTRCDIIALSSVAAPATKGVAAEAGIAEVIVKPMSPKYLLERVTARLARRTRPLAASVPPPVHYGGNVIPLFGDRPGTH